MAQGGRTAIIVGSGFGGLSTAIRLLSDGWQVSILEARPEIGGRASRIQEGGYTFDTGPSLITMPWLFEEVYAAAGEKMSDHVTLRQLQPGYRIFWTGEGLGVAWPGEDFAIVVFFVILSVFSAIAINLLKSSHATLAKEPAL